MPNFVIYISQKNNYHSDYRMNKKFNYDFYNKGIQIVAYIKPKKQHPYGSV